MVIFIYEVISSETRSRVLNELQALQSNEEEVKIRIDSPGGSFNAGRGIYNLIDKLPNPTTAYIDGEAASAAALIAAGADQRLGNDLSEIMIHSAIYTAGGNKQELLEIVDILTEIDAKQVRAFSKVMKIRPSRVQKMLEKETRFNLTDGLEAGIFNGSYQELPIAAYAKLITSNNMEEQKKENVFSSARDFIEARLTDLNILKDEKAKEAEIVEKLKESDDQLKEQIQAEETERVKDLSGADILTAKMVPYAQYRLDLQKRDEVIEAMYAEYISLPTKAEVEDQIKAEVDIKVSAKLDELLKNLKSQSEGLQPNEKFDIYKEPKDEAKEIKAQYDEFEAWKKERETTK